MNILQFLLVFFVFNLEHIVNCSLKKAATSDIMYTLKPFFITYFPIVITRILSSLPNDEVNSVDNNGEFHFIKLALDGIKKLSSF